jgi:hypothetical protein
MLSLGWVLGVAAVLVVLLMIPLLLGMRVIPNTKVGIVEKLWSGAGSLPEGRQIALDGEAGYQAEVLRGGVHFGYWPWQFRVHEVRLTSVPQGKIGYVFARDGVALPPEQTLGRVVACNNFQNARAFLAAGKGGAGQRGRQRAILREGVYAINVALFVVLTEEAVYTLSGWLVREWRIAPISRVQTVDTEHGPLQQMLGLATVTVTTASARGPVKIGGLADGDARELARTLTERTQAHPGDAT